MVFVGITIFFVITSDLHNTRNPSSAAIFTQIESSCLAPATIANHYILVNAKPLRGQENDLIIKLNYNTIFKVYDILANLAICKH